MGRERRVATTMTLPRDYCRQISELGLDKVTIRAPSVSEANAGLAKLHGSEEQLRQIERSIDLDMKAIIAECRKRVFSVSFGSAGTVGLLGERRFRGQMLTDEKRRLEAERDVRLAPYEEVKLRVDNLLAQMDNAKAQLQDYIEQAKADEGTQ
jgi:hypothetical protein